MTLSRFYMGRCLQAFGYQRKTIHLSDAASEMHLLREAEAVLGSMIWEKVEFIEELSVEYWNLRKFVIEKESVVCKLAECQARLDKAHQERTALLHQVPEVQQDLVDQRLSLLKILEGLARERDQTVNQARDIRRSYDGMKMKFEVLSKKVDPSEEDQKKIDAVAAQLSELKAIFSDLKKKRIEIADRIDTQDAELDVLDKKLNEKHVVSRSNALEASLVIGNTNKEISILKAEDGNVTSQMYQLYIAIGRFVSLNAVTHAGCAKAVEGHTALLEVMRALMRSVMLNQRLAATA